MDKKGVSEPKAGSSRKLVRSNANCGDDDNSGLKLRLVNSQTKPALSNSVSKDSSEFTDATLTDLHFFIVQTLHKNIKDRNLILNIEQKLIDLMNDNIRQSISFPPMSSYERMIVHRVAAFFGLDHNVSQDGTFVIASKTDFAKLPPAEFSSLIKDDNFTEPPTNIRSHSSLPRNRRRSQNYDNLSCAMSALSFTGDNRNYYRNYSMHSNEPIYYPWVQQYSMPYYNNGIQSIGYYPGNQLNTNMASFVSLPYPNLSTPPIQSFNYLPAQMPPPPYIYGVSQDQDLSSSLCPDFTHPSNNVQASP